MSAAPSVTPGTDRRPASKNNGVIAGSTSSGGPGRVQRTPSLRSTGTTTVADGSGGVALAEPSPTDPSTSELPQPAPPVNPSGASPDAGSVGSARALSESPSPEPAAVPPTTPAVPAAALATPTTPPAAADASAAPPSQRFVGPVLLPPIRTARVAGGSGRPVARKITEPVVEPSPVAPAADRHGPPPSLPVVDLADPTVVGSTVAGSTEPPITPRRSGRAAITFQRRSTRPRVRRVTRVVRHVDTWSVSP
jgi:hypothetical protein